MSMLCNDKNTNESQVVPEKEFFSFVKEVKNPYRILIYFITFFKYHVHFSDFLLVATFQSIDLNASEHLTSKLTSFGVCYSFNALPHAQLYTNERRENKINFTQINILTKISSMWLETQKVDKEQVWDAERGFYGHLMDANHLPQRVLSSGTANSYTALLRRNKNFILDICAPPNAGFKVKFIPFVKKF
jgi:hypothetical protein